MIRRIFTSLLLIAANCGLLSATTVEVTPGKLSELMTEEDLSVSSLKLTGSMDARDFAFIADNLHNLASIDLSEVTIYGCAPQKPLFGGQTDFKDNQLPAQSFFGMGLTDVVLPKNLKQIGNYALSATLISTVVIPEGVEEIGRFAFCDCDNLSSVAIPSATATIGEYAFADCDALEKIDLSLASVENLSSHLFSGCAKASEIILPTSLKTIGDNAFAETSALTAINLPQTLSEIGNYAFYASGLQSISFPEATEKLGSFAFAKCPNLQTADIPGENVEFGEGLFFYDQSLASINASDITEFPDYLFSGDETLLLTQENLSNTERIGDYALLGNQTEKLELSVALGYIGTRAMEGMTALSEINATELGENVPELGDDVFSGIEQAEVRLKVAEKTSGIWKAAPQWQNFDITEPTSIVKVNDDESSIRAWFASSLLNIESSHEMTDITICSTDGRTLHKVAPDDTSAIIDLSDDTEKIVVVVVTTEIEVSTFKLIRK